MVLEETDIVGTSLGAYRIVARLGVGGMGAVYRAEQAPLGRPVALKVIHDHLAADPAVAARFLREAKIASSLRNPNTVTVYDFGQSADGRLYMAMELLDGESLSDRIGRAGALEPAEAVAIGVQICRSLSEAHGKAIVHRDLKSDNVFLGTADDGSMLVTVLDYGIARAGTPHASPDGGVPEALTQHGMVVGTPAYMSPEQARGELVDGRTDLYALGVILFEMLTGECPFRGDNPLVILGKLLTDAVPPLASVGVRRAPPPELEALVHALLAKDPQHRPATALAVQSRLRALSTAAPEASQGPSTAEPTGPWGLPSELRPSSPGPAEPATVAVRATTPPAQSRPSAPPVVAIDADDSPFAPEVASTRLDVDRSRSVDVDMPLAMRRRSSMPPRPRVSRAPPPPERLGAGTWLLLLLLLGAAAAGAWTWLRVSSEAVPPEGREHAASPAPPATPAPPARVELPPSVAALSRQEETLRADGFAPAPLPAGGWTGSYDLDGGILTLFEQGGRVTGTFESALRAGRLEGALRDTGRLEFEWRSTDSGAVRAAQVRAGRGVLQSWTRRRDRRLSGTWGFGEQRDGAIWLAVPRATGRPARPSRRSR